ncbi:hypothetical protein ABMA28_004585 [Loxostege sticticalis]|uniref:THAP-type domain-containing protein n=1 Tax=Loxostege sticticalis TaxID=481309 RepID=A0ABD0SRR2_LOXSC
MPRRCALGCPPSGTRMHCFPDPEKYPDKFLTWANLAGVKLETASEKEYYHINKRICDIHFTPEDKNRYNRLNALAVPTLHLPANPVNQNNSASNLVTVEQPSSSVDSGSIDGSVTKEHNYSVISRPDWKDHFKQKSNICEISRLRRKAINILLHSWCRSINRILSGKIVYHGDDFTKNAAQRYYNKHRHYRNKK